MADWIVKNLGPEIPWHLSRFSPALAPEKEFRKLAATPQKTLENAFKIAKKAGLHFVYVWATPEGSEEFFSRGDTFCPKCGRLVIKRKGWQPELLGVKKAENKGFCRFCGKDLYLRM
jgi:pyruvate formate lyase activating enzyme